MSAANLVKAAELVALSSCRVPHYHGEGELLHRKMGEDDLTQIN